MKDFWISCGHHLLDRNANGGLVVTDEFLKAYFARLELMPVWSLMYMRGAPTETQIDVLDADNAEHYWHRCDQCDMGLDFTAGTRGPAPLVEAMTRWIAHLLGIYVAIEPLTQLRDAKLTWYVGLDSEATGIGDRLWRGEAL